MGHLQGENRNDSCAEKPYMLMTFTPGPKVYRSGRIDYDTLPQAIPFWAMVSKRLADKQQIAWTRQCDQSTGISMKTFTKTMFNVLHSKRLRM
jgi:hypothetical protein